MFNFFVDADCGLLFASPNTPLLAAGMQAQTKYVSGADTLQRTHPDTLQFTAGLGSFQALLYFKPLKKSSFILIVLFVKIVEAADSNVICNGLIISERAGA